MIRQAEWGRRPGTHDDERKALVGGMNVQPAPVQALRGVKLANQRRGSSSGAVAAARRAGPRGPVEPSAASTRSGEGRRPRFPAGDVLSALVRSRQVSRSN